MPARQAGKACVSGTRGGRVLTSDEYPQARRILAAGRLKSGDFAEAGAVSRPVS